VIRCPGANLQVEPEHHTQSTGTAYDGSAEQISSGLKGDSSEGSAAVSPSSETVDGCKGPLSIGRGEFEDHATLITAALTWDW
jgi:hypothetical protein